MFFTVTAKITGNIVTIDLFAGSIVEAATAGVEWFTRNTTDSSAFEIVKVERVEH